jgi:hypothetical protein
MVFEEIPTTFKKARYFLCAMDARTAARIAGVKLGTLNAWAQRGLIPGMTLGTKGRARDIDADTALRLAVYAALIRFDRPPDDASKMAWGFDLSKGGGFLVVPGPENYTEAADPEGKPPDARLFGAIYTPAAAPGGVAATIARLPKQPRTYLVISVGEIAEQVRQAEQQWQQSHGDK